jgi:hypothetical protein
MAVTRMDKAEFVLRIRVRDEEMKRAADKGPNGPLSSPPEPRAAPSNTRVSSVAAFLRSYQGSEIRARPIDPSDPIYTK